MSPKPIPVPHNKNQYPRSGVRTIADFGCRVKSIQRQNDEVACKLRDFTLNISVYKFIHSHFVEVDTTLT